jgi:hypothetical protein
MTNDTGWNDFGPYSGGGPGLGHPTPNIDQMAKEGVAGRKDGVRGGLGHHFVYLKI